MKDKPIVLGAKWERCNQAVLRYLSEIRNYDVLSVLGERTVKDYEDSEAYQHPMTYVCYDNDRDEVACVVYLGCSQEEPEKNLLDNIMWEDADELLSIIDCLKYEGVVRGDTLALVPCEGTGKAMARYHMNANL